MTYDHSNSNWRNTQSSEQNSSTTLPVAKQMHELSEHTCDISIDFEHLQKLPLFKWLQSSSHMLYIIFIQINQLLNYLTWNHQQSL